jgi:hypothetical protein
MNVDLSSLGYILNLSFLRQRNPKIFSFFILSSSAEIAQKSNTITLYNGQ